MQVLLQDKAPQQHLHRCACLSATEHNCASERECDPGRIEGLVEGITDANRQEAAREETHRCEAVDQVKQERAFGRLCQGLSLFCMIKSSINAYPVEEGEEELDYFIVLCYACYEREGDQAKD